MGSEPLRATAKDVVSPARSLTWAVRQWVRPSAAGSSSIRIPSVISRPSGFFSSSTRNPCELQSHARSLGADNFTLGHSAGWNVTRTAPAAPARGSTLRLTGIEAAQVQSRGSPCGPGPSARPIVGPTSPEAIAVRMSNRFMTCSLRHKPPYPERLRIGVIRL